MLGEIVTHVRFGRGVVTAFQPPRIEVCFDDAPGIPRRFAWPSGAAQFLSFENPLAARELEKAMDTAETTAGERLAAMVEAGRQREALRAALYREQQRVKRQDAAKKAAANRQIRAAKAEQKELRQKPTE